MTASLHSVVAGAAIGTITFTFAATSGAMNGDVTLAIPAGWAPPQTTDPTAAGYVRLHHGACAADSRILSIATAAPWNIVASFQCGEQKSFSIDYMPTRAPTRAAAYEFITLSHVKQDAGAPVPLSHEAQPKLIVRPGPAARFDVAASSQTKVGQPTSITVTALDAYANVVDDYAGSVSLSTSDAFASIPSAYAFSSADAGAHTFTGFVFGTPGTYRVTASDTAGISGQTDPVDVAPLDLVVSPGAPATLTGFGSTSGVELQIPAAAFPDGATITLSSAANPAAGTSAGGDPSVVQIDATAEPEVPVELDLPYDPSTTLSPDQVSIGWWYGYGSPPQWHPVDTTYDASRHLLVAQIAHFSTWGWFPAYGEEGAQFVIPPRTDSQQPPFPDCPAYGVIGSRGSGENNPNDINWGEGLGPAPLIFALELGQQLPDVEYTYNNAPGYPAVDAVNAVTHTDVYFNSSSSGQLQLQKWVHLEAQACPSTSLYLAGYSQGAELTGDAYRGLALSGDLARVSGVVLFGDPLFDNSDVSGLITPLQSRTQAQLTNNGVFTSSPFNLTPHTFSRASVGKVLSYCVSTDLVCQGAGQLIQSWWDDSHQQYPINGDPEDAVQWFAARATTPTWNITVTPTSGQPGTQLTVTGSGFAANSTVSVRFDVVDEGNANTDAAGAFSISFAIPQSAPGNYEVSATDATGRSATSRIDVGASTGGCQSDCFTATQISSGGLHTCAVTTTGGVKCWGYNGDGELGDGTTTDSTVPVDVVGLTSGVVAVSAGWSHTCALTNAGGVKCWGYNTSGQLGNGTINDPWTPNPRPTDVVGLTSSVIAISAGYNYTCALTVAGSVKCWGNNDSGKLGVATPPSSAVPVDVSGLSSGATAITAGNSESCAAIVGGTVKCWGWTNWATGFGFGLGAVETRFSGSVTAFGAGFEGPCVVISGGVLNCSLSSPSVGACVVAGDLLGVYMNCPGTMNLGFEVAHIATGYDHTCALTLSGGVKCWSQSAPAPVDVVGLSSGETAITAGWGFSCAVAGTGSVVCWGKNGNGQLGNGTTTDSDVPEPVSGS